jgi:hypothetical protein
MVTTIAKRMGVSVDEASAIAVRLLEQGRQVASRVRKTIIGKAKP